MKKHIKILGSLLLLSIFFFGCKSKEKIAKDKDAVISRSMVQSIRIAEPKYETLEFKRMQLSLNLNGKQQFRSSANTKIIKDSVIHISIQPFLGIEIFSIRLTPDYIYILDKTKSVYYESDYAFFYNQFGIEVDYQAFQSVLTNQLFAVGYNDKTGIEKLFKKLDDTRIESNYQSLNQQVFVDDAYRIKNITVKANPSQEEFSVIYAGNLKTVQADFPSKIQFQFQSETELFKFELAIDRIALNEKLRIQEVNYRQYRQGNLDSLLEL